MRGPATLQELVVARYRRRGLSGAIALSFILSRSLPNQTKCPPAPTGSTKSNTTATACWLFRDHDRVWLISTGGRDGADRFPLIVSAALKLPEMHFAIDGEVVALRREGTSDFQAMASRKRDKRGTALRVRHPIRRRPSLSATRAWAEPLPMMQGGLYPNERFPLSLYYRSIIRSVPADPHRTRHTPPLCILTRAFRDEVLHVRHQHIAAEPGKQRLFAILPAARTVITSQAHHGIGPFGERWRAIGHSSALKQ
jgi:hypothetical protein